MAFLHQFGTAEETTWDTGVTVDRFHEFLPGESLEANQVIAQSDGLRPGLRYRRGSSRRKTAFGAAGNVRFEVMNQGFGRFLEHMLGSVATAQPDIPNSPTVYAHTFTPGSLLGKSLTLQKGVEQTDGTVQAFTYTGAKIPSWGFSITRDGLLILDLGFDAAEEATGTALATASYPAGLAPFHFAQGSLTIDAAQIATVSDANVNGTTEFAVDRRFLGSTGRKAEQKETGYRTLDGDLTVEFENLTDFYDLFTGDTSAALVLDFTGPIISDDEAEQLTITVSDVRFTGETPKIDGPDVPEMTVPFDGAETDAGDSISIVYTGTEATP